MEKNYRSNTSSGWSVGLGKEASGQSDFYLNERQIGKSVEMISFALKSGMKRAFPTAIFDEIAFMPESGIVLYSRIVTINIVGRNLDELYQSFIRHRVREVREFTETKVDESDLFIESIAIHSDYDRH